LSFPQEKTLQVKCWKNLVLNEVGRQMGVIRTMDCCTTTITTPTNSFAPTAHTPFVTRQQTPGKFMRETTD